MEKLAALGYIDGSKKATKFSGAVTRDVEKTQRGLNLYTSGHAPEAILMDLAGKVLHEWHYPFLQAFPGRDEIAKELGSRYWRKVHLFENGDLLAIYEGLGMIKLDRDSNLLWTYHRYPHHDLEVQPDGTIYVLTRIPRVVEGMNSGKPILEDFITILNSSGKQIREISILKALRTSRYDAVLDPEVDLLRHDVLHTNSLEVMDGKQAARFPFLKKGNVLVSLCNINTVAVIDPKTERVVWALSGMWEKQHQPTILPSGTLLVFDNGKDRGKSRVLEIDPITRKIHWKFEQPDFYSNILGSSQRLPNGNTLITDSDDGRVIEVTSDCNIVWEFFNPHRAGSNDEFVAVIPEMIRLSSSSTNWLP